MTAPAPDRLARLRDFGLSDYAARAYLALLDLGIAEARDVSTRSHVPQAKIYAVLEQLHEKGLVTILPEFPKKYAPVPFDEHLQRLFDQHTKAATAIEQQREELAALFRVVGDADLNDRGLFTVLRGRRNVLAKLGEVAASARHSLFILATRGCLARAARIAPDLAAARARGVEVRVMAPIAPGTLDALAQLARHATIRARELREDGEGAHVAMVVADGARAFLVHFVPDDGDLVAGRDVGVFTDLEAMVEAILAILEPLWQSAASYEARRDELLSGRLPAFTRTYATSEQAVVAFRQALARGVRRVRCVEADPMGGRPRMAHLAADVARAGGAIRALVHVPDVATADALAGIHEVRHLGPQIVARYWLLDEREAFFVVADGSHAAETVVHTSDPAAVRGMGSSFEAAWRTAMPLAIRRQELVLFPRLQPGDLGIGMLFNVLGDAVVVADRDDRIVLWNAAATEVFGHEVHEALGLPLGALMPHDDRARGLAWLADRRAHADRLDPEHLGLSRAMRKDGRLIDVEVMARPLDAPRGAGPYLLAVFRDVTARNAAAEAERRSRERILRIYESMTEAFFALDREWRFIYMNPVAERMRSSPAKEDMGKVLWEAFPDLKGTRFESEYRRALEENVVVQLEEHYPRMGRWFEAKAYPSEEGLSVYYRDVTERKRVQARFEGALAAAPLAIATLDAEGRILQSNAAFRALVGLAEAELAIRSVDALVAPASHAAFEAAMRELVEKDQTSVEATILLQPERGTPLRARTRLSLVLRDPVEIVAYVEPLP